MKRKFCQLTPEYTKMTDYMKNQVTKDLKTREKKEYQKFKKALKEALVPLKSK